MGVVGSEAALRLAVEPGIGCGNRFSAVSLVLPKPGGRAPGAVSQKVDTAY